MSNTRPSTPINRDKKAIILDGVVEVLNREIDCDYCYEHFNGLYQACTLEESCLTCKALMKRYFEDILFN